MSAEREILMFGCTIEEFKKSCFLTKWDDVQSLLMLSMSIQSDVQEMIIRNANGRHDETIRQYLNKSKWVLSEISDLVRK